MTATRKPPAPYPGAMGRDGPHGRPLAVLAAVLLVALAGCSGVLPGTGDAEEEAYTTSGEELNGTTLRSDHVDQLEAAGSFTTGTTVVLESANRTAELERTTAVDLEGDRALQTDTIETSGAGMSGTFGSDTYTAGDETYTRLRAGTGNDTSVQYQHASAPYDDVGVTPVNTTAAMNAELAENAAATVNWTQTGVVERNGTTVTRYEATGQENFTEFRDRTDLGPGETDLSELDAEISEIEATMFVDRDGVVRQFDVRFAGTAQGQDVTMSVTVTTTDVGETTVQEPGWLDEARNRSG